MKRTKILIFIILLISIGSAINYSQNLPVTYKLGKEANQTEKAVSANPASNSVASMVTIGDTIWIGTSRGVSLSTDNGENWTNFFQSDAFGRESIYAVGYYEGVFWAATGHSVETESGILPEGSGLRYTTDNGNTWHKIEQPVDNPGDSLIVYGINNGVDNPKIRALPVTTAVNNVAYDIAFTPGTIWITTFAGGLRKSTDMGETWERVLLPADYLEEISPDDTLRYALQPAAGNFGNEENLNHRVFSVLAVDDTTLYVGTASGINKSTDGGVSWQHFNHQNQDEPISGNFVVGLGYNYATETVWGATWSTQSYERYGISSSSDGGESWRVFLDGERIHNFGFKDGDVIATGDNGAFRSGNSGTSWIKPTSIKDSRSGVEITTSVFYTSASNGNYVWLGSDEGLARLDETAMWQGEWRIFFASQPLKAKNDSYAYPNPFSPKLERLKIKYTTSGKSLPVTIKIFDFGMNYINTVIENVERGDPNNVIEGFGTDSNGVIDFWDGRDDNGNVVPNGVYFYRIEIGDEEPLFGKILLIQ